MQNRIVTCAPLANQLRAVKNLVRREPGRPERPKLGSKGHVDEELREQEQVLVAMLNIGRHLRVL